MAIGKVRVIKKYHIQRCFYYFYDESELFIVNKIPMSESEKLQIIPRDVINNEHWIQSWVGVIR